MIEIVWVTIGGILLLVEFWTADLLFASLGVSGLAAAVAGYFGGDWLVTSAVFAVVALLSILVLRPLGLRALRRGAQPNATNVSALIGLTAVADEPISTQAGTIKIRGEHWTARTDSGDISTGDTVVVRRIDGATAIVERKG